MSCAPLPDSPTPLLREVPFLRAGIFPAGPVVRRAGFSPARVERVTSTRMPLVQGLFTAVGYRDQVTGDEIVALVMGLPIPGEPEEPATSMMVAGGGCGGEPVAVRLHSECLTGDGFGSLRCDCGPQLQAALAVVAQAGCGVVIYLRGHEGRGIGLLDKLRAYRLQDAGADTVDANLALGLPEDAREYGGAVAVLTDLGVTAVQLITNNPAKTRALASSGVRVVRRLALPAAVTPANIGYLRTKRDRMHHQFGPATRPGPDAAAGSQ